MEWRKDQITINDLTASAIAPEIISASRSTDIPAFYSKWFFNRLKAGYSKWINPFNRRSQFISYKNVRAVIFWSKNPKPLLPYLHILEENEIGYYIHFTVNDYEEENLEPSVPPLASRVETFKTISEKIGPDRVIWRFDPLILTKSIDANKLLKKIKNVGDILHGYTSRLVFSFADVCNYKKVQNNLKRQNIIHKDFTLSDIEHLSSGISSLCSGWGMPAFTCGESIDLSEFGIQHNKCIDDSLILKITNNHPDILKLFGMDTNSQLSLFEHVAKEKNLKDQGQRNECGCIISKDIGQYNTCPHKCVYCYANTSDTVVAKNIKSFSPDGESIILE
ncbi:protein of unknown function DUF1848 [Desulfovibrio sp. X2]|uniref:DUF1848 domain-containing protein n=1 Tax=Desulfovibrio sp. X2 TaxID=941449 RepID=UPI000358980C|nr:DUF1848 domain-containing protein [Desulfovibrio sp. X2]EPR43492.1 protein of unknown function DUF1848 [Desulfovibrio sp. X2]